MQHKSSSQIAGLNPDDAPAIHDSEAKEDIWTSSLSEGDGTGLLSISSTETQSGCLRHSVLVRDSTVLVMQQFEELQLAGEKWQQLTYT